MLNFIIELIWWIRARKYRKRLKGIPYFWGEPESPSAYSRYEAFKYASGLTPDCKVPFGSAITWREFKT